MADCADNHSAWRGIAPCCMSDAMWKVAAKTQSVVLSHRSCPWGGQLVKRFRSIFVQKAPEDPCNVFVRPEVRAMCQPTEEIDLRCMETYAPGHALMERRNSMCILGLVEATWLVEPFLWSIRLCELHSSEGYFYDRLPILSPHRLYKDFPEPGDSTYVALKSIWIMRRLPDSQSHYRSVFVFNTPAQNWSPWTWPFLPAFADMFHLTVDRHLNGPSFRDLRTMDENMYLVLSLRSYNRGHPMIPQSEPCSEHTTVSCGQHLGLITWGPFKTHEKFYLSEYLHCFMQLLGHKLKTYNTLDGRMLAPFQCVVVRCQWDEVKTTFLEAFQVQKAAFRRANGGTSTPTLLEDARPHFVSDFTDCAQPEAMKTVVRNTFLERADESSKNSLNCLKRSSSTGKVMTFLV
eukprot:Skav215935  [mRNA]  locus=scaffold226:466236:468548:+ [translate_table: standard]